jgi:hypothetical protein
MFQVGNTIADVVVGIVPLIGDLLDNWFKSNLRNLALLETWLLTHPTAQRYHILVMPETTEYIPKPKKHGRFSTTWFGGGSTSFDDAERERERTTGRVRVTRRMERDEGEKAFGVPSGAEAKGTRARGQSGMEPLD